MVFVCLGEIVIENIGFVVGMFLNRNISFRNFIRNEHHAIGCFPFAFPLQ